MSNAASKKEIRFEADAHVVLFGFDDAPMHVVVLHRTNGWRAGGAALRFGMLTIVAPVVAVVPPHAVWFIGALITGGVLARRRYAERFTLIQASGSCPKCGQAYTVKAGRLHVPHSLPCDECHHESTLRLPDGLLEQFG